MTKRNIVHIEIPTTDRKVSAEFYHKLFGWEITSNDDMNYTMFDPHEGLGGGFTDQMKPGEILIHINSDDIEADLKQATALGGSVGAEKREIPRDGRRGVFQDPD